MAHDNKSDQSLPVVPSKNQDVSEAKPITRRSFSFMAASVPALFMLSCKTMKDSSEVAGTPSGAANGGPVPPKRPSFTSMALGEEAGVSSPGSKHGNVGVTSRALSEEGSGKGHFATTRNMGEEGGPADSANGKAGPVLTTRALNEEGSSDKVPVVTSRKLGEEAQQSVENKPAKHVMTSMSLGEEGARQTSGSRLTFVTIKPPQKQPETTDIATTSNNGEEGANDTSPVMVTSFSVGEEGGHDPKDTKPKKKTNRLTKAKTKKDPKNSVEEVDESEPVLTTRKLNEEAADNKGVVRVGPTSMSIGEEGAGARGGFGLAENPEEEFDLPEEERAFLIIEDVLALYLDDFQIVSMDWPVTTTSEVSRNNYAAYTVSVNIGEEKPKIFEFIWSDVWKKLGKDKEEETFRKGVNGNIAKVLGVPRKTLPE